MKRRFATAILAACLGAFAIGFGVARHSAADMIIGFVLLCIAWQFGR